MRTILRLLLAAGMSSACVSAANAPKVVKAAVEPGHREHIIVNFDNPAPLPADADQWSWVVYEKIAAGKMTSLKQLKVKAVASSGLSPASDEKKVVLTLEEPVADKPAIKQVQILIATPAEMVTINPLTKPTELGTGTDDTTGAVTAAKGKSDSDIYFNGSYTGVLNGDPVFDIDAFAGYMRAFNESKPVYGKFGIYGQVRTKSSPVADPNSFLAYLVYQNILGSFGFWGHFQAPIFNYPFLARNSIGPPKSSR